MRQTTKSKRLPATSALSAVAIISLLSMAADTPEQTKHREATPASALHLTFGVSIPLAVQSAGVEWNGTIYHLVKLDSIRFDLDSTDHLKAYIQAEVTTFDDVNYDVSAAVFDAAGQLLGTARTQCKVERIWLGDVLHSARTIGTDFGVSLDYPRATTFMISVSKRKVLAPEEWQK